MLAPAFCKASDAAKQRKKVSFKKKGRKAIVLDAISIIRGSC